MTAVSPRLWSAACVALSACAASSSGANGALGQGGGSSIDYSIWVLQLPTGSGTSANTVSSSQLLAGYSDAYFYPADDGGQIFMGPASGSTTSGSQHCRTEMRESNASGGQASWAASGNNVMTVSGRVLTVGGGSIGDVTLGQVFNATDSIPLCELHYATAKGGFGLLYEEAKGQGTQTDLSAPIALNTKYTFTLALTQGVLMVSVNGKPAYAHTPSVGTLGKQFYFKFGNYDQTAAAGPISATPYTVVEAYRVVVVHQ